MEGWGQNSDGGDIHCHHGRREGPPHSLRREKVGSPTSSNAPVPPRAPTCSPYPPFAGHGCKERVEDAQSNVKKNGQ
jgi:hypothetical protein